MPRKAAVIGCPMGKAMFSLRIRHKDSENDSKPLCHCEATYGTIRTIKRATSDDFKNVTHLCQFFLSTQDRHEATCVLFCVSSRKKPVL